MTISLSLPSLPCPFSHLTPQSDTACTALTKSPSSVVRLHHYAIPGVCPPSARINSSSKQRRSEPVRFWDVWKYGVLAFSKFADMSGDVLLHYIWGPRRKTWGIQMTLITSFMRGLADHSSLVDVHFLRTVMGLGGLVPLPSDAMVTPVTFRVRKRELRGLLAEFDSQENGSRELSGEWVVGKATWQRLQAEWKADSFSKRASGPKERVIFYIHGGAYYISSAAVQRLITIPLAKYTDARVFALDYRLAPETCFPGPLHDVVSGYLRLVEDLHIPPENIIVAGDSAGGGLSLALLLYLRDNDYPLPSAGILMSPWVDLTMSCHSWEENKLFDIVPCPESDDDMNPVSLYLGDLNHITHPYASPLFGDMKGLPPLVISAGDAEVLRDEISLLAHKAKLAGVEVQHELYEDAVHVFQAFPFLEASTRSFLSIRNYVHNILPRIQSRSPQQIDGTAERELEHEIDNDQARVVSGDGVETASARSEVMSELEDDKSDNDQSTESDTDEDPDLLSENELPSWGRSHQWSPPKGDGIVDYEVDSDLDHESFDHPLSLPPSDGTEPAALRRIHSAISTILPDQESLFAAQARHKRTLSSNSSDHISSLTSPSVRRNSHPDIASLVHQWTNTTNQTLMCKPPQYSRRAEDIRLASL